MLSESLEEKLKESEGLLKKLETMKKFFSKYSLIPSREAQKLVESIEVLAGDIPKITNPNNEEQLIQSELKRRLHGEAAYLDQVVSGRLYDFDTVINILGIGKEDIDYLRPWLENNKERTQEALEGLFHSRDTEGYELPLAIDIPRVRRQAEEFADVHIQKYHRVLGKFLQGLTNAGEFLRDVNAVSTTQDRSYFDPLTNNLAIGINAICYSKEDGTISIKDKELIKLYGHEGMGHGLNFIITKSSELPYFLKQNSVLVESTLESIAQFYGKVLLEDLNKSREIQRALGIEHRFTEIYQDAKDTEQLDKYMKRIFQYGIKILGDKSFGDYNDPKVLKRKAEILEEVAIDKTNIKGWIQKNRYDFDSEGNLNPQLVGELRYCARPVQRALEEFSKRGISYDEDNRSLIDLILLKGLWTPIGFVDNARLRASSK